MVRFLGIAIGQKAEAICRTIMQSLAVAESHWLIVPHQARIGKEVVVSSRDLLMIIDTPELSHSRFQDQMAEAVANYIPIFVVQVGSESRHSWPVGIPVRVMQENPSKVDLDSLKIFIDGMIKSRMSFGKKAEEILKQACDLLDLDKIPTEGGYFIQPSSSGDAVLRTLVQFADEGPTLERFFQLYQAYQPRRHTLSKALFIANRPLWHLEADAFAWARGQDPLEVSSLEQVLDHLDCPQIRRA